MTKTKVYRRTSAGVQKSGTTAPALRTISKKRKKTTNRSNNKNSSRIVASVRIRKSKSAFDCVTVRNLNIQSNATLRPHTIYLSLSLAVVAARFDSNNTYVKSVYSKYSYHSINYIAFDFVQNENDKCTLYTNR